MSRLGDTLVLAQGGRTLVEIAATLEVPADLAAAMVDHWVRRGEIAIESAQCTTPTESPLACRTCPIAAGCLSARS